MSLLPRLDPAGAPSPCSSPTTLPSMTTEMLQTSPDVPWGAQLPLVESLVTWESMPSASCWGGHVCGKDRQESSLELPLLPLAFPTSSSGSSQPRGWPNQHVISPSPRPPPSPVQLPLYGSSPFSFPENCPSKTPLHSIACLCMEGAHLRLPIHSFVYGS